MWERCYSVICTCAVIMILVNYQNLGYGMSTATFVASRAEWRMCVGMIRQQATWAQSRVTNSPAYRARPLTCGVPSECLGTRLLVPKHSLGTPQVSCLSTRWGRRRSGGGHGRRGCWWHVTVHVGFPPAAEPSPLTRRAGWFVICLIALTISLILAAKSIFGICKIV